MKPSYLSNNVGCSLLFGFSGKNILHKSNVKNIDLQEILKLTKHQLRFFLASKEVEINADNLPNVKAIKSTMICVFQNLISNAAKFSAENKVATLNISAHKKADTYEIIFTDNGIGMTEKQLRSVFESGKGLTICQKMLQDVGGKIWINSTLDKGTQVHFTLPI